MVLLITSDIRIGFQKFQLIWTQYDIYMVLGDLIWFWVFSPGFQCPWMVLGVISWFWVFLVGFLPFIRFGCSQRVFFLRG